MLCCKPQQMCRGRCAGFLNYAFVYCFIYVLTGSLDKHWSSSYPLLFIFEQSFSFSPLYWFFLNLLARFRFGMVASTSFLPVVVGFLPASLFSWDSLSHFLCGKYCTRAILVSYCCCHSLHHPLFLLLVAFRRQDYHLLDDTNYCAIDVSISTDWRIHILFKGISVLLLYPYKPLRCTTLFIRMLFSHQCAACWYSLNWGVVCVLKILPSLFLRRVFPSFK